MSQKFYKTKKFKSENEKWQKKLKKAGFKDIEDRHGNIHRGSWDFNPGGSYDMTSVHNQITAEYEANYRQMAENFLEAHTFESRLDKNIWMYHVEGLSLRDICKVLRQTKVGNWEKDFIAKRINALKRIMLTMLVRKDDYDD